MKKLAALFLASAFVIGLANPLTKMGEQLNLIDFSAYGTKTLAAEEPGDEFIVPDKLVLHYHRDDNSYTSLRFWIWTIGVDGVEVPADGVDDFGMHITIYPKRDYPPHEAYFFIIKYQATWNGQTLDTEIQYKDYPPTLVGNQQVLEIWSLDNGTNILDVYKTKAEASGDRFQSADITPDWHAIHVVGTGDTTTNPNAGTVASYKVYAFDKRYLLAKVAERPAMKEEFLIATGTPNAKEFDIPLASVARTDLQYQVAAYFASNPNRETSKIVGFTKLYDTSRFKHHLTYDGVLGAVCTPEATEFMLWAPTSARVMLKIYQVGTPSFMTNPLSPINDFYQGIDMEITQYGVWYAKVAGDLHGKYYTYYIVTADGTSEVVDPYATSAGVNGLRGQVVDFAREDVTPTEWASLPLNWDKTAYDIGKPTDLVVSEVHIRDLTMDDTWTGTEANRGKYLGFIEKGTTYTRGNTTVKTGFDHLEELGVNAIQILPFYDQDNDEPNIKFNWGYNPLNYNVLEGGYSSDPYNGFVRINEFRQLVAAFANNANKTRIIMDVVYNHVSSVSASNLTKILPRYFFRTNAEGSYTNGSGVGNEVKSENKMARKLIVDSCVHWVRDYKIKGFRFDLMGLMDVQTMDEVRRAMYKIDPDIVVYGEGWTGMAVSGIKNATPTNTSNIYRYLYPTAEAPIAIGGFNDAGRDAIRGSNNAWGAPPKEQYPQWGFMNQGVDDIRDNTRERALDMIRGTHTDNGSNPYQMVAYASCHDNYTAFDQMLWTMSPDGGKTAPSEVEAVNASLAAHAATIFSQGITFINGGEEIFRSKRISEAELAATQAKGPDAQEWEYIVNMYGYYVSHNSYKSDDECNSYKYDRKVTYLSQFNSMKEMIRIRKLVGHYAYPDASNPENVDAWSTGNSIGIFIKSSGKSYFIFIGGRANVSAVPFDNSDYSRATLIHNSKTNAPGYSGGVTLATHQIAIYSL
ncbi:MAG: hypothetical protein LBR37_00890 [Erysipelotrichaceae bacterium]|jgi:pullulanase|nr:hypothetical protein [Erysipelotrichaceae bacterium]